MKQVCFDTLSLLLSLLGLSLPLRDLRDRLPVILRNSISLNSSAMRGYNRIDTYAVSWQSMPHYHAAIADRRTVLFISDRITFR